MSNIQEVTATVHQAFKVFGRTPLKERLKDILEQSIDLSRARDVKEIQDQTGDLLASVLALCAESGWDPEKVLLETLDKVKRRSVQYSSLGRRTNVAFLGGSFNPIHEGHIQVAQTVLNASGFIDEVWLVPCNKSLYGKELVSGEHRLEMCRIAAKNDRRIRVCDWEIRNNVSGETHHLLKQFLEDESLAGYKMHFIVGMDNAYKCPKWVNWEYVEQAIPFIIVPRAGEEKKDGKHWFHKPPHFILEDEGKIMEMSSSQARGEMYNCGVSNMIGCSGIDEDVFKYIKDNELY